jgi:hypothetical protein
MGTQQMEPDPMIYTVAFQNQFGETVASETFTGGEVQFHRWAFKRMGAHKVARFKITDKA